MTDIQTTAACPGRPWPAEGTQRPAARVIGLGNTLRGDDGAGVRIVEQLARHPDLAGREIEFIDGGTLNFTLLEHFDRDCPLIVADAVEMGGRPGEMALFVGEAMDAFLGRARAATVHEASIAELCDMARLSGRLPVRRAMVGVQPAHLDWSTELSAPVLDGINQATAALVALLGDWS